MWRVGLLPGMAWGEGAEEPLTVGSPVSQVLEAWNKFVMAGDTHLIDYFDSRVESNNPDENLGFLGKPF